jgi:hypothetical protein
LGDPSTNLPITTTSFVPVRYFDEIVINMTTSSEENADYMLFEGSNDGYEWTLLDGVINCENTLTGSVYKIVFDRRTGRLYKI